jgi:hypothetical protein
MVTPVPEDPKDKEQERCNVRAVPTPTKGPLNPKGLRGATRSHSAKTVQLGFAKRTKKCNEVQVSPGCRPLLLLDETAFARSIKLAVPETGLRPNPDFLDVCSDMCYEARNLPGSQLNEV